MTPPTPFLEIEVLRKRFGAQEVLKGVDLTVGSGERLVLLGPSGCGKTTLLNLLAGLLTADGGRIRCQGEVLDEPATRTHLPMQRRGFAMVFQDFALWPHMTVEENVAFGLRVQGIPREKRRTRVGEVLEMVQMSAFGHRRPGQLSGGQKQRVSIARALAVEPRLLLLDEPLSALDARLREDLKGELSRLLRETGVTAVYVTHDQAEAFALGDRIALMNGGRLVQVGTPRQVYAEPASTFAATFLGVSNLFRAVGEGDAWQLANGSPATARLVVRREAVTVAPPAPGPGGDASHGESIGASDRATNGAGATAPDGSVRLRGICRRTDFLGDRHEAWVELDDGTLVRGFASPDLVPLLEGGRSAEVRFHRADARIVPE
jgi:ABC-type Fe3+/spermidine/putrescine transport system ATPase subunit